MAVYPFLTLYPQQVAVVHFQVDDEGIQNNASMGRATHRLESFRHTGICREQIQKSLNPLVVCSDDAAYGSNDSDGYEDQ